MISSLGWSHTQQWDWCLIGHAACLWQQQRSTQPDREANVYIFLLSFSCHRPTFQASRSVCCSARSTSVAALCAAGSQCSGGPAFVRMKFACAVRHQQ